MRVSCGSWASTAEPSAPAGASSKATAAGTAWSAHGVISLRARDPLARRLAAIARGAAPAAGASRPKAAAVEEVFYLAKREDGAEAGACARRGAGRLAEAGLAVGEYSPLSVKTSVVGYGRAEKQQVQLMVRTLTGLAEPIESEDAADALAVAICHATLDVRRDMACESGEIR